MIMIDVLTVSMYTCEMLDNMQRILRATQNQIGFHSPDPLSPTKIRSTAPQ